MGFHQFKKEQFFDHPREELWDFISKPGNLKKITPGYMGFDITTAGEHEKMYEGMIISYKVAPLLGIKTIWVTEITHIKPASYFVDEQRIGPYTLWHHQHLLEDKDGGTLMTDIISYQPPFGVLGEIANHLVIKQKINEIFDYRQKALSNIFKK